MPDVFCADSDFGMAVTLLLLGASFLAGGIVHSALCESAIRSMAALATSAPIKTE